MAAARPASGAAAGARPWRVGLTGGIASGKSTVAALFAALGVPVIDADEAARAVVAPDRPLLERLRERFGADVITAGGDLDRRALRDRVFADPALRVELEALMHPAIREEMEAQARSAGGRYQIFAIPLLVPRGGARAGEARGGGRVDRILVVDCSEATQLRRLRARDGSSAEQAAAILAAQASRDDRLSVADDVITNEGDVTDLRDQVERLHFRYLELANDARGVYGSARTPAE